MYCKNCGNSIEESAKFCPSCGKPNEQKQQDYTAPKPFEKNSIDESQNFQYQKSTFSGKQMSTGTSGSISFGKNRTKKKGLLGKMIKLTIIIVIAIITIGWLLGGNEPIYDIAFSNSIDADYNPINPTKDFLVMDQDIYVTYSSRDLEIGTIVYANWLYITDDGEEILFATQSFETIYDEQVGFFRQSDTNGWDIGDYEVQFVVDDEIVATGYFNVK